MINAMVIITGVSGVLIINNATRPGPLCSLKYGVSDNKLYMLHYTVHTATPHSSRLTRT